MQTVTTSKITAIGQVEKQHADVNNSNNSGNNNDPQRQRLLSVLLYSTGTTAGIGQTLVQAACTRYHEVLLICLLILQLQLLYTMLSTSGFDNCVSITQKSPITKNI